MKNQEDDGNLRMNPISPKNQHYQNNFNGNNTSYYLNSRNFPGNNHLETEKNLKSNFKNMEYSKLQNQKLTKKKIAPLENKGIFMSKTNKIDFMKYINKTFQNEDNNNYIEEDNNNNKKGTFKKMNDLTISANSPNNNNMKKTLNLYSVKNSNGHYSNKFNNLSSPNNMSSTSYSNQISSNDNLRNFLNSANNYNNNYPFQTTMNNNLSPHNNNNNYGNNNINFNYNKSRFLFDTSNYMKFSKIDSAKFATKPAGIITSFGVNTNFGNVR